MGCRQASLAEIRHAMGYASANVVNLTSPLDKFEITFGRVWTSISAWTLLPMWIAAALACVPRVPVRVRGVLMLALPVLALVRCVVPGAPLLALVAAGENPLALAATGGSVVGVRTGASVAAGMLGALGGALLILTVSPTFVEGVTAGRGFLALALVVFARWKPLRLVPGALLVAGATALQYRLQAGGSHIPYAVFLALPSLLALFALAFARGRGGAPKALGTPAP